MSKKKHSERIILGIACHYHDASVSLVKNGEIIFASQEERHTRKKHDASFPTHALQVGLESLDLSISDVDDIVFYEKPFLKFDRLIETYIETAPFGLNFFLKSAPRWFGTHLNQRSYINQQLKKNFNSALDFKEKIYFSNHHLSHAASAFYPSPFKESAIITIDGVGEHTTTSIAYGSNRKITTLKTIRYPHSLGLLYSAFTAFCGFKVNSGEYKLMGLAPYGKPRFVDTILENLLVIDNDGGYELNMNYFERAATKTFFNKKFAKLFKVNPLEFEEQPTQTHLDIAASIQKCLNRAVIEISREASTLTGSKNLCLAGGVALNCVSNAELLNCSEFDNCWIQPAAGDAGGSLGAALAYYYMGLLAERKIDPRDRMNGSYLGKSFKNREVKERLTRADLTFEQFDEITLLDEIAMAISKGFVVGWFQGRSEFGPRALGNRSILADPRSAQMQQTLNLKIKFRESFRPFAPSILSEEFDNWFDGPFTSEYMLLTNMVKHEKRRHVEQELAGFEKLKQQRSEIPAVTHVDYSARVQVVKKERNRRFHALIKCFFNLTSVPMIINTSFNVRGEPIVETIDDAINCFINSGMDALCINDFVVWKKDNLHITRQHMGPLALD